MIATAAGLLCDQLFGFHATWAWKLLFGGLAAALALLGPIGFVRRFVRKFAIWAVALSVAYLAWWIVDGANLGNLWSHPGAHHGSFWLAVDTVIAVTVSWAPLVADYTRFSRDRRSAFFGVGIGYLLPTLFQFGFGSILVLSRGVDPNHPELILTAIAGGGAAAALALLALTVDETDEAFANVYSSAVSTQNVLSRVPQRVLIACASVIATAGALAIDMRSYQRFLLLLGAVFVPLLGVLAAHWLYNGAHYSERDIFGSPSFRPGPIVAWAAGFLVYEWLYQPTGLGFWSDLMAKLPTPDYQIGASLPSFAARLRPDRPLSDSELAVGDRDRRAADLDALDLVSGAVDPRVELRGAADLDALRDLDLLAERDPPVTREVQCQRPGRRPGRRILGDTARRREHPVLPPRALAGEAVEAERGRLQGQAGHVRPERRNLVLRAEADVHVPDAVVVELDRELRLLHSQDVQEPLLAVEGLDRRQRLLHAPEHDPPVLALEPHRNETRAGLELDLLERERRAEDERGAERRVTGERHLDRRREDPDPRVPVALRLVDEHGLGEVHLLRDRLQLVVGNLARVREDGDLVALQRRVREDVCDDVAEARHALTLREEGGQGAERLRDDAKVRPAATLLTLDEPRLTKDLEMVAHGRLREAERSGQVADAGLSARLALDQSE